MRDSAKRIFTWYISYLKLALASIVLGLPFLCLFASIKVDSQNAIVIFLFLTTAVIAYLAILLDSYLLTFLNERGIPTSTWYWFTEKSLNDLSKYGFLPDNLELLRPMTTMGPVPREQFIETVTRTMVEARERIPISPFLALSRVASDDRKALKEIFKKLKSINSSPTLTILGLLVAYQHAVFQQDHFYVSGYSRLRRKLMNELPVSTE